MEFVKPADIVLRTPKPRLFGNTNGKFFIHLCKQKGRAKPRVLFVPKSLFASYVHLRFLKYTTSSPSFIGKTRSGFWARISSGMA